MKTHKSLLLLIVVLAVSACSQSSVIRAKVSQGYDKALDTAEFTLCYAASIGSIRRKYGTSPDKMEAWRRLCSEVSFSPFIKPVKKLE